VPSCVFVLDRPLKQLLLHALCCAYCTSYRMHSQSRIRAAIENASRQLRPLSDTVVELSCCQRATKVTQTMIVLGRRLSLVSGLKHHYTTESESDRKEGDEKGTGTIGILRYGLAPNI
jgi:hypothetical protein